MHPSQFTLMENWVLISFLGGYDFEPRDARNHLHVGAEDATGGRQEKSVRGGRGEDIFFTTFGHVEKAEVFLPFHTPISGFTPVAHVVKLPLTQCRTQSDCSTVTQRECTLTSASCT